MQQLMVIHLLQCLNIYHLTHTHYCILFRANPFQPNFPLVSHRMLLYINHHKLVHLGSQTKILYVNLAAQFALTGRRLISSVLERLKVFKIFLSLRICSGTVHRRLVSSVLECLKVFKIFLSLRICIGTVHRRLVSSVLERLEVFKIFLFLRICSGTVHRRLVSSVLERLKVFKMFLSLRICSGTVHRRLVSSVLERLKVFKIFSCYGFLVGQ